MSAHTPGPWVLNGTVDLEEFTDDVCPYAVVRAPGDQWIALVEIPNVQTEANATLIAAAPELLETLRAAVDDVALSAEIAKARGDNNVFFELSSHLAFYRAAIAKATPMTDDRPTTPDRVTLASLNAAIRLAEACPGPITTLLLRRLLANASQSNLDALETHLS